MAYHQYFPVEFINLQEEMTKHPDVVEAMSKCPSQFLEDRLAALCTHLGFEIDGEFDVDELSALAEVITKKLYEKRTGIASLH